MDREINPKSVLAPAPGLVGQVALAVPASVASTVEGTGIMLHQGSHTEGLTLPTSAQGGPTDAEGKAVGE